jgi:hypothetical protein
MDDPASTLENRALTLWMLYKGEKETHKLENAVELMEQCLRETPPYSPETSRRWRNLASFYATRSQITETINCADLEASVQCSKEAIRTSKTIDKNLMRLLSRLSRRLFLLHEATGNTDTTALDQAIYFARQALESVPTDAVLRLECLRDLSHFLYQAYRREVHVKKAGEEIHAKQYATERLGLQRLLVNELEHADPTWADQLCNLVDALLEVHNYTTDQALLDEAEATARRALHAISGKKPSQLKLSVNLAHCLLLQYFRNARSRALDEGIEKLEILSLNAYKKDPYFASGLSTLGNLLGSRYEDRDRIDDLKASIKHARRAVQVAKVENQDEEMLALYKHNLSIKLCRLYERFDTGATLMESLLLAVEAMSKTPSGSLSVLLMLRTYGNARMVPQEILPSLRLLW